MALLLYTDTHRPVHASVSATCTSTSCTVDRHSNPKFVAGALQFIASLSGTRSKRMPSSTSRDSTSSMVTHCAATHAKSTHSVAMPVAVGLIALTSCAASAYSISEALVAGTNTVVDALALTWRHFFVLSSCTSTLTNAAVHENPTSIVGSAQLFASV